MVFKHNKSCPYYNVKLSYIFLRFTERKEKQRLRIKLPLLTYIDHKIIFTNPKLTVR